MLTGNKTTFKVRQMPPDIKERMLSQSGAGARTRDLLGLRCLPGECVLQRVALVRKKLASREGRGWLSGTLFCTPFRVAFTPQDGPRADDNADPVLLGDHDVALASIEKVVVVGPSRTKLLTASSSLKFTPEELVLYCRDMRVICFLFDRLTPDAQVIEMSFTIAKTYQPPRPGAVLSFQNAALGSVEMKQFLSNRRRDDRMNWFESAADWEQEVERCGASTWRVSSVNDRFEMSTSLSRFIVVPQKVFDTELKKSFAHFHEGRIPRWCWRHPGGSDLLRMSSFQNNIYHEKDDLRNLELVLFGCQSAVCVVVELGDELPSPADIQLAHSRLRSLCLGDISTSVSVPDDKWFSTLENTRWLEYSRACLRKAAEVACLLRGGHLTVALQEAEDRDLACVVSSLVQVLCDPHSRSQLGFQSLVQKEWVTAGHRFHSRGNYHRDNDKDEAPVFLLFLDCVWQLWSQFPSRFQLTEDFLLALHDSVQLPLFSTFLSNCQRERCRRPQNSGQSYTPVNGWRDVLVPDPSDPSDPPLPPVWDWSLQHSKDAQDRFTQPVPRPPRPPPLLNGNLNTSLDPQRLDSAPGSVFLFSRGTFSCPPGLPPWRSAVYRKSHRRAPSSESVPGLERLLKTWTCGGTPDPGGPLLPLLLGPCLGLWRGCYLRGALQAQAFSHPASSDHAHPVERLAREVQHLQEKLAQVDPGPPGPPGPPAGTARTWNADSNLNQNSNNGTFLFPAAPPPPASAQHRRPPRAATATSRSGNRDPGAGAKHTFLFRPDPRSDPPAGAAAVPKSNGPSLAS
ncbi:LOW QUALITY PROTEIN: myotubularin-related protein 11 [Salarias fasciatus]|uniref:LOW QUALITY PROTEIN: myotubularin-related protein 11 n=1 Tax=Salarias fasciatus TaxID=181472 RepID=UPI0011767E2E|nr:LOW QUALITY PROTEIN: myotubularin-related protein 11-like [Salarias fasciatus]